ncbi:MAG: hypothetical protein JOZ27_05115, partial [Caulobacteraceae bacterium]|nr:hypothetical protein [Caulobacteraceae bacterium]
MAAELEPTRTPARRRAALTAAFVACAALMPVVYGLVAFHGPSRELARPQIALFVVLNTLANLLVMRGAVRLQGRADQNLSKVGQLTLLVHGALAFGILVGRTYYSIPITLTGA